MAEIAARVSTSSTKGKRGGKHQRARIAASTSRASQRGKHRR